MISSATAEHIMRQHLGESERAEHSRLVADIMAQLALLADGDVEKWRCTGLLHDIDLHTTTSDRSQHGMVAAQQLLGQLSFDALTAIAAHDHRSAVHCDLPVCKALRLADAVAALRALPEAQGLWLQPASEGISEDTLRAACATRPHLADLVIVGCGHMAVTIAAALGYAAAAPPESGGAVAGFHGEGAVRPAAAGDLPELVGLYEGLLSYHASLDASLLLSSDTAESFRPFAESALAGHDQCVFVADGTVGLLGYAMAHVRTRPPIVRKPRHGMITDIYVRPEARGAGVGGRLVRAMEMWFSERDVTALQVGVLLANAVGRAFWSKQGFKAKRLGMVRDD